MRLPLHNNNATTRLLFLVLFVLCADCDVRDVAVRRGRQLLADDGLVGFPVAALRDSQRGVVRLYGQFKLPAHDPTAGCYLADDDKGEFVTATTKRLQSTVEEGANGQDVADYHFECQDVPWATKVTLRLGDGGKDLSSPIGIITMGTQQKGKVGACLQPVYAHPEWLDHWIDFHLDMGISEIVIHQPKGAEVDAALRSLSAPPLRRIQRPENTAFSTIQAPMKLVWHEYWPAPSSKLGFGNQLMMAACHYRLRYEYEYVVQLALDEFIIVASNATRSARFNSLPDFLDANFPKQAAALEVSEKLYPVECQTRQVGEYSSRFTLAYPDPSGAKHFVRPKAVEQMVDGKLAEVGAEWQQEHPDWQTKLASASAAQAFIKHITAAPIQKESKQQAPLCAFGLEAAHLKLPNNGLVVSG